MEAAVLWAQEAYERTPWGAILVAIGVLIGGILSKVGEIMTIWFRGRSDAEVARIKAQAEAQAQAGLADRVGRLEELLGRREPPGA